MAKKPKKRRKTYTREFKLEAVKQVVEGGRSLADVADGLGINRGVLGRWKAAFLEIEADTDDGARKSVEEMAHRLLANPVIESYRVELL